MNIIKVKDYDEMSLEASLVFKKLLTEKKDAVLGLATGSTPLGTYKKLIEYNKEGLIDFYNVSTVNLDEYVGLEPTHDQSYRYFMNENLFDHININKNHTNVPDGMAKDLDVECKRYDILIDKYGAIDLQLLGLGQNGHIGFNEPSDSFSFGTNVVTLTENTREANKRFFKSIDEVPKKAITMGLGSIMSAKKVLMVANGKAKADAVAAMVKGKINPSCPASILRYHKDFILIVDSEAASKI